MLILIHASFSGDIHRLVCADFSRNEQETGFVLFVFIFRNDCKVKMCWCLPGGKDRSSRSKPACNGNNWDPWKECDGLSL